MGEFIATDTTTGQKLKLTGDSPPTEAELEQIFASQIPTQTQPPQENGAALPSDFPAIGTRGTAPGEAIINPDGSRSTERTISVGFDGRTMLIPTIVPDDQGFLVKRTNEEAIELFKQGKNPSVGDFGSQEEADVFAKERSGKGGRFQQQENGAALPSEFPGALGSVAKFGAGLFRGLQQAKAGAKQLFAEIPSFTPAEDPAAEAQQKQELKSEIAMRDIRIGELGLPGQAGALIGETIPSFAIPGGPVGGAVKRVAGAGLVSRVAGSELVRRVGGGVAADVVASVADPVREDETRLGNLGRAATFSGGIRGLGAGLSPAFRKITNARTGQFADADVKKLVDSADTEQISIFFDDITQGTFAQKASVAAEMFGRAGTGAGRIRQNKEALAAATRWLNRVSNDSDDFAEIIQKGLVRKLDIFKREASRKYARVGREIGDAGSVETKLFNNAADKGIASEVAKGTRSNAAVVDFLNRFKEAPRGDFNAMIEFRSDFNKELGDFLKGDVSISKSSIDALMGAKNALDADMTAFAKANGANDSWRAANKFYQDTVIQFKKGKLKSLLNEKSAANFDEQAAWKYLVQNSTNPKRARLMWQSLDTKGREAVRFGLVKDAMEKASPEGAPFSPARFAGYLESREAVINQFFRGREGEEIKGLIKVMRHIERAGQFAENPPTGQRVIPLLFAGGAFFQPGTVAAATGVSLTIKGLFQTKVGRNLLLASSKATPGSRQFDRIIQNLETVASRASN